MLAINICLYQTLAYYQYLPLPFPAGLSPSLSLQLGGGVWGVDSVKSTVTVLEEGDFTEEGGGFNWRGYFCIGGYQFLCRSAF